jgi:hypothetical protein
MFSFIWNKLSDEWLGTSRASLLFIACSVFTLALIPVFLGLISGKGGSLLFQACWGSIGVLGAPATIFLWIGMWKYWARVDRSRRLVKRFWFIVLLVGFWYGSVLYCYFVYLPRTLGARGR